MMETRYVAVYRLPGIIGLPDGADVEILPRDGSDVRVILTLQRDPYLQHLKRRAAFGMMLLSAFVGGQPGGDGGQVSAYGDAADLGTAFALATSLFGANQVQVSGNIGYTPQSGMPSAGFRTTNAAARTGSRASGG